MKSIYSDKLFICSFDKVVSCDIEILKDMEGHLIICKSFSGFKKEYLPSIIKKIAESVYTITYNFFLPIHFKVDGIIFDRLSMVSLKYNWKTGLMIII